MCVLLLLITLGSAAGNVLLLYVSATLCWLYVSRCALTSCKVVVTFTVQQCIICQFVYDLSGPVSWL